MAVPSSKIFVLSFQGEMVKNNSQLFLYFFYVYLFYSSTIVQQQVKLSVVWSDSVTAIQKKLKIEDFSEFKLKYKDGNEFMKIADGNHKQDELTMQMMIGLYSLKTQLLRQYYL